MDDRDLQRARKAERREQMMAERDKYLQAWTRNMGVYWQERMDKLRINDTGRLRSSIVGILHPGQVTTIEFYFLLYGKYISDGTAREFGRGYTDRLGRVYKSSRGGEGTWQAGQLPFLLPGGEKYRHEHKLDKEKKVGPAWGGRVAGGVPHGGRDWYYRKYYASRMVLFEREMATFGKAYQGILTLGFDALFQRTRFL